MPARTQVTPHSCAQGWSAICGWACVPPGAARPRPASSPRRASWRSASSATGGTADDPFAALHLQTILADGMHGGDLPTAHGAPVRLRVKRQLGDTPRKHLAAIEAGARVDGSDRGRGSLFAALGFSRQRRHRTEACGDR